MLRRNRPKARTGQGPSVRHVSLENDHSHKQGKVGASDGPRMGVTLKKSKFSEEQVAYVLRQADVGFPVSDVC